MGEFRYFVILADMRTGSNFLEASLNSFPSLKSFGELFNRSFVGKHNASEMFGFDLARRDADPVGLINEMVVQTDGIPGFRLFSDHDPRVIKHVLTDTSCAKIRLTRSAIDSYVSWKIAKQTDQWKLSDAKNRRTTKVVFQPAEYRDFLAGRQSFESEIERQLQITGQAAFRVNYDVLGDVAILNGMARFIGETAEISTPANATKRQNPEPLSDKVSNFAEMEQSLNRSASNADESFDHIRGPNVREFCVSLSQPLIFMPISKQVSLNIVDWLGGVESGLSQSEIRNWQKRHRPHIAFSVLSHPVERAYRIYCQLSEILEPDALKVVQQRYNVELPETEASKEDQRSGFLSFLKFLKINLDGQTSLRINPSWATQSSLLSGISSFRVPDVVIHEADLQAGLDQISRRLNFSAKQAGSIDFDPMGLLDIYDETVEKRSFSVYRKDYISFGFTSWR